MANANRVADLFSFLTPVQSQNSSSARQGLLRLLLLRSFVTVASMGGLLIFLSLSSLAVPLQFIGGLLVAVAFSIFFGYWRLQMPWPVSNAELFCHLLVDVIFLIILVFNTGGVSNPLISYLLVLLAVSATMLPRPFVYTFAVGGIVIYSSFLLLDLTAGHDMTMGSNDQEITFQLHLVGMWVIFLVSAVLISVFITRMANAIRVRESNLAQARENEIRNEQLVAIGTLAAGTAHALGTPLSTMAVVLTDLDRLTADELRQADIKEDISLLRQQVTRCKNSLTQLIRYYHKDNAEQDEPIALEDFATDIQDYIVNIHPAATVNFTSEDGAGASIPANLSVKHAVINIIENGIKAARSTVDVHFKLVAGHDAHCEISITDDGPGIPAEVMERQGEPFISIRKEGMGLGIFLANAAIQRLGGSIEMFNLKTGGAQTVITIPLRGTGA